jgi:hypothetical protein
MINTSLTSMNVQSHSRTTYLEMTYSLIFTEKQYFVQHNPIRHIGLINVSDHTALPHLTVTSMALSFELPPAQRFSGMTRRLLPLCRTLPVGFISVRDKALSICGRQPSCLSEHAFQHNCRHRNERAILHSRGQDGILLSEHKGVLERRKLRLRHRTHKNVDFEECIKDVDAFRF